MKILSNALLCILLFVLISYLSIPRLDFPDPPPDSIQSQEFADQETPLRRAYFTNFTREKVIAHYKKNFTLGVLSRISFLPLRLNYPPEESQTLIRDQTRSTFLEELVYPMRDSIYINGFEPKLAKDDIWYQEQHFRQKVIVRLVPSNPLTRIAVGVTSLILLLFLINRYISELKTWRK